MVQLYVHLWVPLKSARPRLISPGIHGWLSREPDQLYGRWVEANKLFAKLTSANIFDLTHHAVRILDCLLNSPMKERKLYVSPAAQHLIFSGIQLFEYCTIADGLTQWNKWLQAFLSAAKDCTLEASERGLARRAAQIMKSLVNKLVHVMENES